MACAVSQLRVTFLNTSRPLDDPPQTVLSTFFLLQTVGVLSASSAYIAWSFSSREILWGRLLRIDVL